MFIDTHAHLYSEKFDDDRAEMIERARAGGVGRILMPAIDRGTHPAMLDVESRYPGYAEAMIGLHPVSVRADYEEELAEVERRLGERDWVAIGEIGMDLHWDTTYRSQQEDAFLRQCTWAAERDLPISIHARKSLDELLELVRGLGESRPRGVFHCFIGSVEQARRAVDLGFHIGVGGVATFKNGGLRPVIEAMPHNRILMETDAPYLAPVPKRGRRNESAYLPYIAALVAECWGVEPEEVAKVTTANARELFNLIF